MGLRRAAASYSQPPPGCMREGVGESVCMYVCVSCMDGWMVCGWYVSRHVRVNGRLRGRMDVWVLYLEVCMCAHSEWAGRHVRSRRSRLSVLCPEPSDRQNRHTDSNGSGKTPQPARAVTALSLALARSLALCWPVRDVRL